MSPKTHSKSAGKSCYRGCPISARGSNRKDTVTRWTCFKLPGDRNTNKGKVLVQVTAVTFWPTTERALALLRGSKITCYFPRGYLCYFCRSAVARRSTPATSVIGSSPVISADMGAVTRAVARACWPTAWAAWSSFACRWRQRSSRGQPHEWSSSKN
jgi:hypothetical protein